MNGYAIDEAAEVLGVSEQRVRELVARGVLSSSETDDGLRVFLQASPTPPSTQTPDGGARDTVAAQRAFETSPFRELLNEFRNLTERYGQALLALGESRGEVAALRGRVELLEARMDLRLTGSVGTPVAEWHASPAAETAEIGEASLRTAAAEEIIVEVELPSADGSAAATPEFAFAPQAEPQGAAEAVPESEQAAEIAEIAEAKRLRQRRSASGRFVAAGIAEALARAVDPSVPEFPSSRDEAPVMPSDEATAPPEPTELDVAEPARSLDAVGGQIDEPSVAAEEEAVPVPSGYSSEFDEPDWLADGDYVWLDAAEVEALGEASTSAAAVEAKGEPVMAESEPEAHAEADDTVVSVESEGPAESEAEEPEAEEPEAEEPEAADEPETFEPAPVEEPEAAEPRAAEPQPEAGESQTEAVTVTPEPEPVEPPTQPEAEEPEAAEPEPAEPEAAELQPGPVEEPAAELVTQEPQGVEPEPEEPETFESAPPVEEPEAAEPQAAEPQAAEPQAAEPQAAEPQAAEPQPAEPTDQERTLEKPADRPVKPKEPEAPGEVELMWLGSEQDQRDYAAELEVAPGWRAERADPSVEAPAEQTPSASMAAEGGAAAPPRPEREADDLTRIAADQGWDPGEVDAIRSFLTTTNATPGQSDAQTTEAPAARAKPPTSEGLAWPDEDRPAFSMPGGDELRLALAAFGTRPPRPPAPAQPSAHAEPPAHAESPAPAKPPRAAMPLRPAQPPQPAPRPAPAPEPRPQEWSKATPSASESPSTEGEPEWLHGRRDPAARAYRRLRRIFPR